MKQLAPAALLSLIIGGGAAYLLLSMSESRIAEELRIERERVNLMSGALSELLDEQEKNAYILINKAAEAGKCKATTTSHVRLYAGQKIKWNFNVVDESCLANGERVQIQFKSTAPTEVPQPISDSGKKHINAKIKDVFIGTTLHQYSVFMVPPAPAKPYPMEDPELEIIGNRFIKDFLLKNPAPQIPPAVEPVPPPAPAPAPAPNAPPAKKQ